jgi:hypothetical protein
MRLPYQHCGLGPDVLSANKSDCDRVSKRDRLVLTHNLSTGELWRSRRWAREMREFSLSIPVGLQEFFTCCNILRHGTFRLYFPSERKVCSGFLSPLKIHRLGRVRTLKLWIKWQNTLTTTPPRRQQRTFVLVVLNGALVEIVIFITVSRIKR